MRQCKMCDGEYSLWSAQGDGLCPNCREKKNREEEEKRLQEAKNKIHELVADLTKGAPSGLYGLAHWNTSGREAVQSIKNFGTKVLLGGVGGLVGGPVSEVLKDRSLLIGLVALSSSGNLHTATIGEAQYITPEAMLVASIRWKSATSTPISWVGIHPERDRTTLSLSDGQVLRACFPGCFLENNTIVPTLLARVKQKVATSAVPCADIIEDVLAEQEKSDTEARAKTKAEALARSIKNPRTECPRCGASILVATAQKYGIVLVQPELGAARFG